MPRLTVYKLDENGRETWRYPADVLERQPHFIRLEASFNRDDLDLGYTTFKRGDRFVEYYYADRWYNIFAVYDRDSGHLKGWYGNICRPARIMETALHCEDLALDVWVRPDGETIILDEDEFTALALSAAERESSQLALDHLLELAQNGRLPT